MTLQEILPYVKGNVVLEIRVGTDQELPDRMTIMTIHGGRDILEKIKRSPVIDSDIVLNANFSIGEPLEMIYDSPYTRVTALIPKGAK